MSRDFTDIPEVFRRAFEEDGNGRGRGTRTRRPGPPWWANRWVWLSALFLVVFLSFNWIVTTYTEWLWFISIGYEAAWLKQLGFQVGTLAAAFALAAAVLVLNWRLAWRIGVSSTRVGPFPRSTPTLADFPGLQWVATAAALFLAFLFAGAAGGQWQAILRYLYRLPYGAADPIFNRDIGFYLFELPVYRFLDGWAASLLIVTLLGVVGIYVVHHWPDVQQGQWRPVLWPAVRRHLAVLATILAAVWGAGTVLEIYELMYSARGVAFGASYTDLNASLPALRAQAVLLGLLALALATNVVRLDWRPPLVAGVLWLASAIFLGGMYPAVLQRYAVEPNELDRERPYIEHNITYTRLGFGLDDVITRDFGEVTELEPADLEQNEVALRNVRLWDYRPLQQTYAQLQGLRPYYQFSSIDIDRYEIDGETRQVMLAARELNTDDLPSPTWVNQKLEFTHGYGVVMNPVDRFTPEGRPEFFIRDLPPVSTVEIEVERPEVYYGELISDTVFVASGLDEFDYPQGDENVYSQYEGEGGIVLSNALRRLAFSVRFGELNVLLSEYITPETRVLLHRQIQERVRRVTPFLALDNDPYLVVADGRLIWIQDAYTLSRHFPYSTPADQGYNYIRNAAKITIDAYDGSLRFYLADPGDPLIQAYARALPGLFRPLNEMPESLQSHIRYPEDLFRVQTQQYLKYHMTDVQVFYNQEDLWAVPLEIFETQQLPMEPYYVLFSLPGETETEYLLILPYTPANKNNMVAWIAARSDPPHYGELVVYEMPKQALVFGPIQVEGRIDQDPQVSQQITLWSQRGSSVIRGNLIVIPLNNSFLYVEPLYILSETSALPELKRVIVASGNHVVMRETLDAALASLLGEGPAVDADLIELEGGEGTEEPAPAGDETVEQLIQSANAHFLAAETAQRDGDWATYGRELELLRQDLARLVELTGEAVPDTTP